MSTPAIPLWPDLARDRPFDVVGLGQISLDHVATLERPPELGSKVGALEYRDHPGGQVATALLACTRLGLRGALLGAVGDDPAADVALAPLAAAGVALSGVRVIAGARTRTAFITVVREGGERTIVWHRDPRLSLGGDAVDPESVRAGRALLIDTEFPEAVTRAAAIAREAGIPVVLDADQLEPGVEALLHGVDFPLVSWEFAETVYGTTSPRDALARLAAGGARMAVVTLGEAGAIAQLGERVITSPGFCVPARDTTGAGDVFHAAFVWALLEGRGAEEILRTANAAAALSCAGAGAQGALPDRKALGEFLAAPPPLRGELAAT